MVDNLSQDMKRRTEQFAAGASSAVVLAVAVSVSIGAVATDPGLARLYVRSARQVTGLSEDQKQALAHLMVQLADAAKSLRGSQFQADVPSLAAGQPNQPIIEPVACRDCLPPVSLRPPSCVLVRQRLIDLPPPQLLA